MISQPLFYLKASCNSELSEHIKGNSLVFKGSTSGFTFSYTNESYLQVNFLESENVSGTINLEFPEAITCENSKAIRDFCHKNPEMKSSMKSTLDTLGAACDLLDGTQVIARIYLSNKEKVVELIDIDLSPAIEHSMKIGEEFSPLSLFDKISSEHTAIAIIEQHSDTLSRASYIWRQHSKLGGYSNAELTLRVQIDYGSLARWILAKHPESWIQNLPNEFSTFLSLSNFESESNAEPLRMYPQMTFNG